MTMQRDFEDLAAFDRQTSVVLEAGLADHILRDPRQSFDVNRNFLGKRLDAAQIARTLQTRPLLNPGLRNAVAEQNQER